MATKGSDSFMNNKAPTSSIFWGKNSTDVPTFPENLTFLLPSSRKKEIKGEVDFDRVCETFQHAYGEDSST